MTETPKAVVLLSGGMDSTVLLYMMRAEGYTPIALSVRYGQRHSVELSFAAETCKLLGVEHRVVDFEALRSLLGKSSLTTGAAVPEGHYAAENMAQTVVPNRNAILLAIAYGLAVTVGAKKVCTAVHAGDHAIYPDCRPGFIIAFEDMEKTSITREIYGMSAPSLYSPFVFLSKADIVKIGSDLKVPWEVTWSCYNGDLESGQCGRCGTCVERIGAFNVAGVFDPIEYQDKEFAVSVLKEKGEWVNWPNPSARI